MGGEVGRVVPLDIRCADIQEAEPEIAERRRDGRRRRAPGVVGVAVGEAEAAVGLDLPEGERVAVARPGREIDRPGRAVGVADLLDPARFVGQVDPRLRRLAKGLERVADGELGSQ